MYPDKYIFFVKKNLIWVIQKSVFQIIQQLLSKKVLICIQKNYGSRIYGRHCIDPVSQTLELDVKAARIF